MDTANKKIVVELPEAAAAFLENYAREHGMIVAELIERYIDQLKSSLEKIGHPDIREFSGIIPANIDVRKLYQNYLLEKYR